jgi:DNA topoisomerase-1
MALKGLDAADTQTRAKKNVVAAIETVAKRLGNTPSVCRKCYVHPEVLTAYLDGDLVARIETTIDDRLDDEGLSPDERNVLNFLKGRLQPRIAAE